MNPEDFWYIKLRQNGSRGDRKKPAEAWGGYDTEFETNDRVYSYEETQELDHSNFAIVGSHWWHEFIVIDVDCHMIDGFDPSLLEVPDDGVPIVKSTSPNRDIPGFHYYCKIDNEPEVNVISAVPYVDIKAHGKGHVVSPWHNDQYQIVRDDDIKTFSSAKEINKVFSYDGDDLITDKHHYSKEFGGDTVPDPHNYAGMQWPRCLRACIEARVEIPRDGSHQNPWRVDSALGRRLVAFGFDKMMSMRILRTNPPQDGYDERESSYQMDMLYKKNLHPDSDDTLRELGIMDDDEICTCRFCHKTYRDIGVQFYSDDPVHAREFSI